MRRSQVCVFQGLGATGGFRRIWRVGLGALSGLASQAMRSLGRGLQVVGLVLPLAGVMEGTEVSMFGLLLAGVLVFMLGTKMLGGDGGTGT